MKQLLILLFILSCTSNFAQDFQKKYKYVIVPAQYGFTTEINQFQLNVLTRVLLQEQGFEVIMNEGEKMPREIIENQCLALKANVVKDKGLFVTNLKFQLFNCFGNLVYESIGTSRQKAFKEAYQEAIKEAISEFSSVSYNYVKRNIDAQNEEGTVDMVVSEMQDLPFEERAVVYLNEDNNYWLLKNDNDYLLYSDKGETVFAALKQADRGTYAYDSEEIDGAAYFTADGDLVVEYLAKNKDAVQKLVYKRQ